MFCFYKRSLSDCSITRGAYSFHSLIGCLNPPHTYHEAHRPQLRGNDDLIRIEAAHVIASLAGSEDALSVLLDLEAPRAFLLAISYLQPSDPVALRSTIIRGLRSLVIAMADIAGPSQWGLKSAKSRNQNRAKDGLSYLFQVSGIFEDFLCSHYHLSRRNPWMFIFLILPIHAPKSAYQ
jgi:hypothetical protein